MSDWTPPADAKPVEGGWKPPTDAVATPDTPPFVQAPPQGPPTASSTGAATSLPAGAPSGVQGGPQEKIRFDVAPEVQQPLDAQGVVQTRQIDKEVQQGLGLTPEQAQRNIAKTGASKRHYNEKFGPLGLDQVAQYREKVLPMEIATVKSMEKRFLADKAGVQQTNDPAIINSLNKQALAIDDAYTSLQRDARMANQRELEIKSGIGSAGGATWNEYLGGHEDVTAGLNRFVINALIDATPTGSEFIWGEPTGTPRDVIKKKADERVYQKIHGVLDPVSAKGTTPEYIDKMREDFLGGAWLGLARSAPGMTTPYMTGIGFQTFEQAMQEMQGPDFSDMTENEKTVIAVPIAAVTMALERFGFKNLAGEKSVVRGIAESGLRKLGLNASGEQVEAVMNNEVKDWASRYLAAAGTGAAAEFETGAAQDAATNGLKELANELAGPAPDGSERFDTPDGWREYLQSTFDAGLQEAVGGFIMAQPYAVSKAMRTDGVGKNTSPEQFEMVEKLAKDPNYRSTFEQQQQQDVESGEITPEQAAEVKKGFDQATKIVEKIPDDLPTASRQQAFDLLAQREALRQKDPALVATKVEAINEKLRALEGVPKTPEPTTDADGKASDPAPIQPTGEEAVQTSLLPDPQTQQVDIPASEQVGLGAEPVLAEGAVMAPDAAPETYVPLPDDDQGIVRERSPGQMDPGPEQQAAEAVDGVAPEPLGNVEGGVGGPTTGSVPTVEAQVQPGQEARVRALDEDQSTQQAPEAASSVAAPGVPDGPATPRAEKPLSPEQGKRATTQRLIKDHPEFKDVLSDRAVYYNRMPHDLSRKAAEAFVEANGLDASARAIEEGRPMPGAVRSMLGRVIMAKLRKEGELERAADFHEKWVEGITDAAQTLSALRTLYGEEYTADTILFQAQHRVNKQRDKQEESVRGKTDRVAKGLRKINEEGAEEVIRTRRVRQKVDKAGEAAPTERTTDPPNWGAKNRVVTKSRYQEALRKMRGQMNSGVSPEMVIVAAFHIEAGARSFAAVAEKVTKRLGRKALPYLKEAYKEAFAQLKREGVDVGEVSSDEEINAYVSEKLSPAALKEGLKALDLKIDDIIRKHWTEQEDVRRTLADKFIQDAGLDKEEAESLAKAVQSEFDRLTKEKKEKLIRSLFSAPVRKTAARKVKGVEDELILLTNLGAFSDAELVKRYGDAMGFAKLTEEDISRLQGLALEVQNAKEGRPKFDAIERLVAYEANLKGISVAELVQSVWYAHMLSGYMTHAVNFLANAFQVGTETGIAMLQRPRDAKFLAKAVMRGAYKGWLEAGASFRTGTSPIRGKVEIPAALERIEDQYPKLSRVLRLYKYVRRAIVAADVMGYETAKELRAYQWAVRMARFETEDPSMTVRQKALDYLNETDTAYQKAKEEAQLEYDKQTEFLKSEHEKGAITKKELSSGLATAARDQKRRVFELVENERNAQVLDASGKFGARVTYNYKPEGMLGAITNGLNSVIEQVPVLSYVVPFRNIIANVANEAINYTPLGFVRAATKRGSITGSLAPDKYKQALSPKMTPEQLQQHKLDLVVKASLGIALMTTAFVLSDPGDDEDPTIQVTANGYGDWKKNMALKETGWQPYSFKIGNKWYSYQYTPLVLVFGIVGNYRDAEKYRKEKITDTQYTQFATAMGRTLPAFLDMTFLSTVDKVLSAVSNPSGEGVMEDLMKQAERTAKTLAVPALLTQASKEVQDLTQTPQKDTKGSLLGETLKDIPVLRDQYENAINALGEPIIPKTDRFISSVDPDPVWNLMADKAYAIQTPNPNGLTIMDGEKERVMTPKERHDFLVLRGKRIREKVESNMTALLKKDKDEFAEEMRKYVGKASAYAKKKIGFGEKDPDYLKGVRELVED